VSAIVRGGTFQREVTTRRRILKGYSRNRQEYDARRRRTARTPEDKAFWAIVARDPCGFCSAPAREARTGVNDVDHIVHLDAGGSDGWTNYAALCPGCNRGVKKNRTLLEALLLRTE
jgi:5-methylcytosine-specific restriction endonuclease McrA